MMIIMMIMDRYNTSEIIALSIVMTMMLVIVIIGNMLVIIAIATEHNLSGIQNWLIASLAFADLSIGLIIMPFSLAYEVSCPPSLPLEIYTNLFYI